MRLGGEEEGENGEEGKSFIAIEQIKCNICRAFVIVAVKPSMQLTRRQRGSGAKAKGGTIIYHSVWKECQPR